MRNSAQKIRTSHVGRLPVPSGFEETALRLARGEVGGEEVAAQVVPVVAGVVKRQVAIGLDCIGDGEYWSALDIRWFDQQMTGLGTRPVQPGEVGSMRESTRERDVFRTLYTDMDRVGTIACIPGERPRPPTRERVIVSGTQRVQPGMQVEPRPQDPPPRPVSHLANLLASGRQGPAPRNPAVGAQ